MVSMIRTLVTRGLQSGNAAEEIANLINELAGKDSKIIRATVTWLKEVQGLRSSKDPTYEAHNFCNQTRKLFQQAIWIRIAEQAEHHPKASDLRRLSNRVLSRKESKSNSSSALMVGQRSSPVLMLVIEWVQTQGNFKRSVR